LYQEPGCDLKTQSWCWIVHKHEGNRNPKWERREAVEKKRRENEKTQRAEKKGTRRKEQTKTENSLGSDSFENKMGFGGCLDHEASKVRF
jgi:hypothetical protein